MKSKPLNYCLPIHCDVVRVVSPTVPVRHTQTPSVVHQTFPIINPQYLSSHSSSRISDRYVFTFTFRFLRRNYSPTIRYAKRSALCIIGTLRSRTGERPMARQRTVRTNAASRQPRSQCPLRNLGTRLTSCLNKPPPPPPLLCPSP